jgi:hypothetical protein
MTNSQPKIDASLVVNRPLGNGRFCVRCIIESRSRSYHWFNTLALAATRLVPINADNQTPGAMLTPSKQEAKTIATPTVSNIIKVIRGLDNAK